LHRFSGILQRSGDVGSFEVREVGKDLVGRSSGCELADDRRDRDPQPTNARRAPHLGRIDRDSLETHAEMIRPATLAAFQPEHAQRRDATIGLHRIVVDTPIGDPYASIGVPVAHRWSVGGVRNGVD
jgi:hypothetical protein